MLRVGSFALLTTSSSGAHGPLLMRSLDWDFLCPLWGRRGGSMRCGGLRSREVDVIRASRRNELSRTGWGIVLRAAGEVER